jgi:hypothetical protein
LEILFSSIPCTCPNQCNLFSLIVCYSGLFRCHPFYSPRRPLGRVEV